MYRKSSYVIRLAAFVLITLLIVSWPVSAATSVPMEEVSPTATWDVVETSPEISEAPEQGQKNNRSKQWIFFLVTSALSLAIAIPLAIRSGNKRYGK